MTREEFTSLPVRIALGLIYDVASSKLRDLPAPSVPRPPQYDGRLARQGGFQWISELSVRSLEWWAKKKRESSQQGGEYADKDKKLAETLERWLEWRRLFPDQRWSGKRNDDKATGEAPSDNPPLRTWPERKNGPGSNSTNSTQRSTQQRPPEDDFGF